jgi:hypothetical protein
MFLWKQLHSNRGTVFSVQSEPFRSQLSWKGAAVQRGLGPGSRGLATVRKSYKATTSEDTVAWKRFSVIL